MGKQKFRDIGIKIARYFMLGFIILLSIVLPIVLLFAQGIRYAKPADLEVFAIFGTVALLLGVLWVVLWAARRTSLRVWLAYESLSPVVYRVRRYVLAALCGVAFLGGGAYQAFDGSHQQTSEWSKVLDLPEFDAAGITAASNDTLLAITGILDGNEPVSPEGYVAYIQEKWYVIPCNLMEDEDCIQTTGYWREVAQVVPGLMLTVSGGTVSTLPVPRMTFGGNLTEWVETGSSLSTLLMADYNGQRLPDGSLRTRGLRNGDLVTVVGRKAITGGVVPSHLIGGGHDQLVAHFRAASSSLAWFRISGVILMILSPIVVVFVWRELD